MTTINEEFDVQYEPARICDGKDLCIKYYAFHPVEKKKVRKVLRFNHLKSKMPKKELIKHLKNIVNGININLAAGKNPFIEADMPKAYDKLPDAITMFLALKKKDMRPDGFRSYSSLCKKLSEWINDNGLKDCPVITFKKDHALSMMNELTLNETISSRTWNNYMIFYRTFWNWLIDNNYCKENPFNGFKKKRENEKIRDIIPNELHTEIVRWCRDNKPELEIVIDLVRASFIRPSELCQVRIKDIDLFNQVIRISADVAKTHNSRFAYMPAWLCQKLVSAYRFDRYSPDEFLVSSKLKPGFKQIETRTIDKYWAKMRTKTGIGMQYQLYSYRDTGINTLEDMGVIRKVIRQLTDHKSDKMVGKYTRQPSKELINNVVSLIKE